MPSHEADNCCSLKTNNKDPDYGRRKNYMDNFIHILLLAVTADKPNPDYGSQDKNKGKLMNFPCLVPICERLMGDESC